MKSVPARPSLLPFVWLSVAAALITIALKAYAYWLTGSVGLLADALESLVNLAAASVALVAVAVSARPPDAGHPFGHDKAEYFSSAIEGALILVAAVSIGVAVVERLLHPRPIEQAGIGLAVSVLASLLNLAVARVLLAAGTRHRSIALEADGHHLMTDVWTSAGVLLGVGAVWLTGWNVLDPLIGLAVALNIVWTGAQLLRRSALGLLDSALPEQEQAAISAVLDRYVAEGIQYHALRTRGAGARRFVSLHVLVPGHWSVQRGHDLLEQMEAQIRQALGGATVFTHLEPLEDPASWADVELDRPQASKSEKA
jgi:cation diffusion facilitator family transporter